MTSRCLGPQRSAPRISPTSRHDCPPNGSSSLSRQSPLNTRGSEQLAHIQHHHTRCHCPLTHSLAHTPHQSMSSLRTGLLPQLLRAAHAPRPVPANAAASRFFSTPPKASSLHARFQQAQVATRVQARPKPRASNAFMYAIGLGLAGISLAPRTKLDGPAPAPAGIRQTYVNPTPPAQRVADDPPVESILSIGQLSFGAVCGISAGVFVKKGLKALAFALGGIYVLLQVSLAPHLPIMCSPTLASVLTCPVPLVQEVCLGRLERHQQELRQPDWHHGP